MFEQEQLDGLIKTNDELERQKKYYEYLRESTLNESDSSTRESANRNLGINYLYDESQDFWGALGNYLTANTSLAFNYFNGNLAYQQAQYLEDFEAKSNELEQAKDDLDKAVADEADKSIIEGYQSKISTLESEIDNTRSVIQSRIGDANTQLSALDPDNSKNNFLIAFFNGYIKKAEELLGGAKKKSFTEIFECTDYEKTTETLTELWKQGKLTEETFASVEGIESFTNALKEVLGESVSVANIISSISSYLNQMGEEAKDTGNSVDDLAAKIHIAK